MPAIAALAIIVFAVVPLPRERHGGRQDETTEIEASLEPKPPVASVEPRSPEPWQERPRTRPDSPPTRLSTAPTPSPALEATTDPPHTTPADVANRLPGPTRTPSLAEFVYPRTVDEIRATLATILGTPGPAAPGSLANGTRRCGS